jgi:hypothetical protein
MGCCKTVGAAAGVTGSSVDRIVRHGTVLKMKTNSPERHESSLHARFPRIVFDEAHQQAWTIDAEVAKVMNPAQPEDASYARAAERLRLEGFRVDRHTTQTFEGSTFTDTDVLVIPHFSDPRFENTTGQGNHRFTTNEIEAIVSFVASGGGLVILGEHEHEKYGTNLNDLLERFGLRINHSSVVDTGANHNSVAAWIKPVLPEQQRGISAKVRELVLYRAGTIRFDESLGVNFTVLAHASPTSSHPAAPLAVYGQFGQGRIVVVTDSDWIGDDSVDDADHLQMFSNLVTWASAGSPVVNGYAVADLPESWLKLKAAVADLRSIQSKDGSIDLESHDRPRVEATALQVRDAYVQATSGHTHDATFHAAALLDFDAWVTSGFATPDYISSLQLFRPDLARIDGLEHIVVLPMYTQNGNPDRVFEAIWIKTVWPDWIAELESNGFSNPAFVPIEFVDFTEGYNTHSAVFFPETVATSSTPKFLWGGIFCDREAARFRAVTKAAAELLRMELPADVELLLNDPRITQETYVLWDLVHDRQHSLGELPFDPFMIKQRSPYWMYSLEELRCDLSAYLEMDDLAARGIPHARLVKYAVLFDRLLRFPVSGDRVRNYDGLVGQIIFAHLHRTGVLRWANNTMSIDWDNVDAAIRELSERINALYRDGIDHSKMGFWLQARSFVRELVPPHPGSRWEGGLDFARPTKELLDEILPDEFPLNVFYEALSKKLAPVIESVKGAKL